MDVDGCSCTLNPRFLQGQRCLVILATSAMVHHNFEVSCLCSAGHLHHTHEKVALAVRIPAQFVRYFMPAHKKINVDFVHQLYKFFITGNTLLTGSLTFLVHLVYVVCAIMWFPLGFLTCMCMLRLTCVPSLVTLTCIIFNSRIFLTNCCSRSCSRSLSDCCTSNWSWNCMDITFRICQKI